MPRPKRYYDEESRLVFVTSKTFRNTKVFNDPKKASLLLQCIDYQVKKKYINLFAWVIMPDHFHLLVEVIGKKNISEIMQSIKGNFSWMLDRDNRSRIAHARLRPEDSGPREKHELRGGVSNSPANHHNPKTVDQAFEPDHHEKVHGQKIWQPSFHDHVIRDENDFNNHIEYIHYNPVKHGLVDDPGDWKWSSFKKFYEDEGIA